MKAPTKYIKLDEVSPEVLAQTRELGGKWAAYQNLELGNPQSGHLQFLRYGEECTYTTPPAKMPDSHLGIGWRYAHVGFLNLTTGEVQDEEVDNG